jgi:CRISPR-associated protein Cmr4
MEHALLFLYAETPLHPGGSESLGGIDLPVQREASTRLPVIWGETAKGAVRAFTGPGGRMDDDTVARVFGARPPAPGDPPPTAGAWSVGDARVAAFPVPTLRETFAWVSSPLVLERVARMAALAGIPEQPPGRPVVRGEEVLAASDEWQSPVALGPMDLQRAADPDGLAGQWAAWLARVALPFGGGGPFAYFKQKLGRDFLIVADDLFQSLTEECVEIVARVQLDDAKTVKEGPWYVEYLPAETIVVSYQHRIGGGQDSDHYPEILDGRVLTLGGDETIGKGLLWCRVVGGVGPQVQEPSDAA